MLPGRTYIPVVLSAGMVAVVCGLFAACGPEGPDPLAEVFDLSGVPVSKELEPAVDAARRALREPSQTSAAAERLARHDALEPRIDRPETRAAAAVELLEYLTHDPDRFPWLDLAHRNRQMLGAEIDFAALYQRPVLGDSTTTAGLFLQGLVQYSRGGRGRQYLELDLARTDSLSLDRIWLVIKQSQVRRDRGEGLAALDDLLDHLPAARAVAGERLEARVWTAIGSILRRNDRLDDALYAQVVRVALCRKIGAGYEELNARLALAEVLQRRRELTGAFSLMADCIVAARELDHPWLLTKCLNRAAGYHAAAGDLESALSFDRESLEVARALRDSFSVPVMITNVAYDLRLLGRLDEARAHLDEGRRWVAAFPDPRLVRGYPLREVPYFLHVGDYATADSLLQVVMGTLPATSLAVEEAEFHLEQIDFARDLGRPDLAYRSLARLEDLRHALYDKLADSNRVAEFALASADLLGRQGEFGRAAGALDDAARAVESGGGEGMAWKLERSRGELALLRNDPGGARVAFGRCLELAAAGSEPSKLAESRFLLGAALLEDGLAAEALATLESGIRDDAFGSRYRVRLSTLLYTEMARARAGDPAGALVGFGHLQAFCTPHTPPDFLVRLNLEQGRALALTGDAESAAAHLATAVSILRGADRRTFSADLRLPNRRLRRELVEALVGFHADHPAGRRASAVATATLAYVALLTDGEVRAEDRYWPALQYFVGNTRSFRWWRHAGGLELVELPGRDELARLVAPVLADVGRPGAAADSLTVARLARILPEDLAEDWPRGRTLHLAPDDLLQAVPWAMLPLSPSADETMLDRGPVLEVPEASAVRPSKANRGGRLLVLGDDRPLDTVGGAAGASLRHAEAEAAGIAELWPDRQVTLLLGEGADGLEASAFEDQDVVHIASHARFSQGADNRSTLRLAAAGAPLTADGVGRTSLSANLIYLSCCEGDTPLSAGGLGSFARACLRAGAGAVVASGQRIDDEAAAALALAFYRHWLAGATPEQALRAAQLEIRAARPAWRHPYYWGTYRIIGAGG